MSDLFSSNLSTQKLNDLFKNFFDSSLKSAEGKLGIRAALGLNSPSRTEKQAEVLKTLAADIRKDAINLFGDRQAMELSALSDIELVNRFIGGCYRASLPEHRAERLDNISYPSLGANRGAALECMVRLTINALAELSGGKLTLGKVSESDRNPMSYLQALHLGLKVYNSPTSGVKIESPSVHIPLNQPITLVGKQLAIPAEMSTSVPNSRSATNNGDIRLPRDDSYIPSTGGGNQRPTKVENQSVAAGGKEPEKVQPQKVEKSPSVRTVPYIEDKDMFKELGLSEVYRKGAEMDPKIQALWDKCGFNLDPEHPLEHDRKMEALKKWYSNGRSLARALDFLSAATHFAPKFGMDTSRDPITLEFNETAKKSLYNGLVEIELAKKGIIVTDDKGAPVSFWDLRKNGFEFSLKGSMYVTYYGSEEKVFGHGIPEGSKITIKQNKGNLSFEVNVSK